MTTSPRTASFEVLPGEKISRGTLSYVKTRVRQWAFNLMVSEFRKSGITQAELCRRLDKSPEVVSRMLSRPSNIELDTFSSVIFAVTGGSMPTFGIRNPATSTKATVLSEGMVNSAATTDNIVFLDAVANRALRQSRNELSVGHISLKRESVS